MRCKGRHFILNYKHLIFFCIKKIGFIPEVTNFAKLFKQ